MTDAKKNENSKAAVAELLGERKRPWYVRAVPAAVVLALAAGGGWYWWLGQQQGPKANYVTQTAKTGNLDVTVSADGTLNPIRTVTLGSELSGIVRKVNVDVMMRSKPTKCSLNSIPAILIPKWQALVLH